MRITVKTTVEFPRERIVSALKETTAFSLNRGAESMRVTMQKGMNKVAGWRSVAGGYPGNSTGHLWRDVSVVRATPDNLKSSAGSGVPQAFYMQFGSKASSGKALTVPLNAKARNGLAAAGGIRQLAAAAGLVFIKKSRNADHIGTWVKVISKGKKSQRVEPWVALRRAVKARPWATLAYAEGKGAAVDAIRRGYDAEWSRQRSKILIAARGGKR